MTPQYEFAQSNVYKGDVRRSTVMKTPSIPGPRTSDLALSAWTRQRHICLVSLLKAPCLCLGFDWFDMPSKMKILVLVLQVALEYVDTSVCRHSRSRLAWKNEVVFFWTIPRSIRSVFKINFKLILKYKKWHKECISCVLCALRCVTKKKIVLKMLFMSHLYFFIHVLKMSVFCETWSAYIERRDVHMRFFSILFFEI
jgi:hypothetical protein